MAKRRQFTSAFKTELVLEVLIRLNFSNLWSK